MKRVLWRPSALADLGEIHDYIALDNPVAARQVVLRIEAATHRLSLFPRSGRVSAVVEAYELVVPRSRFIVTYQVGDAVEVVGVFHAAQNRRE